jgi:hypothetical protein
MPEAANNRADRDLLIEIKTLLGEIIRRQDAMALDIKGHGDTLDVHEKRLTAIEVDRAAKLPDYDKHVHKVNNHIQEFVAYKAGQDAETKALRRHLYAVGTIIGLLASIGGAVAKVLIG